MNERQLDADRVELVGEQTDLPGPGPMVDGPDAPGQLLDLARAAAGIGTFDWDLTTGTLHWDDRLLELFGLDATTFNRTIEGFNSRLHPEDLDRVTRLLQKAIDTCGDYEAEYRVLHTDGSLRWVAARGRALCDKAGITVRVLGAAWDVTARRDAQDRAEHAAARERLLNRIISELNGSLDGDEAVGRLAQLVVPVLADWCILTLVDDQELPVPVAGCGRPAPGTPTRTCARSPTPTPRAGSGRSPRTRSP
ncbi:Putative PAS/PAC sensor protein [Modestobacter italicus]|uniref:histidine kinase n=1 Tax=Modestobacter italicus (strain DSM 44449 / CECT 9708 / BC 501) TaxID=2732864 RepID=I4EYP4_MODI5|nr:PAS domain-containing protein [Modestobacter marinus]CCH88507.1 Putative PAS/PAC sensor protein [Modestobacter marinus]